MIPAVRRWPAFSPGAAKRSTAPKKPKAPKPPFDPAAALRFAWETLELPPTKPHIVRPPAPVSKLVGMWALPLELCVGVNVLAELPHWKKGQLKAAIEALMIAQSGGKRASATLPGRPVARVIRFSSVESDKDNGFSKLPIDRLCVGRLIRPQKVSEELWERMKPTLQPPGLWFLRDDKPSALDLRAWWEPAPPGKGCVYVELYEDPEAR